MTAGAATSQPGSAGPDPAGSADPAPRQTARTAGTLRTLLASQQAGLLFVILLLGTLLTLFAGSHVDRAHRPVGQQLPQLLHADPDRHRRQLLRDHGGRRDDGDHLGRHRPLGRIDLRAGRRGDGDGAPRAAARPAARRPSRSAWRSRSASGCSCGALNGLMVVGLQRPPVHHHARHDVDPARHRVRGQRRREHPAAAGADARGQGVARPRRVALSGADAGDAGRHRARRGLPARRR